MRQIRRLIATCLVAACLVAACLVAVAPAGAAFAADQDRQKDISYALWIGVIWTDPNSPALAKTPALAKPPVVLPTLFRSRIDCEGAMKKLIEGLATTGEVRRRWLCDGVIEPD